MFTNDEKIELLKYAAARWGVTYQDVAQGVINELTKTAAGVTYDDSGNTDNVVDQYIRARAQAPAGSNQWLSDLNLEGDPDADMRDGLLTQLGIGGKEIGGSIAGSLPNMSGITPENLTPEQRKAIVLLGGGAVGGLALNSVRNARIASEAAAAAAAAAKAKPAGGTLAKLLARFA